jgi:hypothetical protein
MVGKRGGNLAPVETLRPAVAIDHERLREEREYRALVRRERAGAYWFAATKWGMLGLVAGMILGGVGMYYASFGSLDLAQEAVTKGAIVERLRQEQEKTDAIPAPLAP